MCTSLAQDFQDKIEKLELKIEALAQVCAENPSEDNIRNLNHARADKQILENNLHSLQKHVKTQVKSFSDLQREAFKHYSK